MAKFKLPCVKKFDGSYNVGATYILYNRTFAQLINSSRLHFVRFIIVVWPKNGLSKLTVVQQKYEPTSTS